MSGDKSNPAAGVVSSRLPPRVTTIEGYALVKKNKEVSAENEIRVTNVGRVAKYVTYIARLLNEQEKDTVIIRATGKPIANAVAVSEVVKRRFRDIHQQTSIGLTEIVDEFEPEDKSSGLEKKIITRSVPFISIILSTEPSKLQKDAVGYQPPIDQSLVSELPPEQVLRYGRDRGGRGRGRPRGRGRGRGRPTGDDAVPSREVAGPGGPPVAPGRGMKVRRQRRGSRRGRMAASDSGNSTPIESPADTAKKTDNPEHA